jgi:ParB/RepB/Spo0J family partition protein
MAKKRRLRRNFKKTVVERIKSYDTYDVLLSEIYYDDEFNSRGPVLMASVEPLARSIEATGLMYPLILQPYEHPGTKYRIVSGHRRFKAFQYLGRGTVPCVIQELDEKGAKIINLMENLERQDLNIYEEAMALQKLYPDGISLRIAAKELNRPTRWVHVRLKLAKAPAEIQKAAASGRISQSDVDMILRRESPEEQVKALLDIIAWKATKRSGTMPTHLRYFKRPYQAEIVKLLVTMLDASIIGLAPRALAYCGGFISKEEFADDVKKVIEEQEARLSLLESERV